MTLPAQELIRRFLQPMLPQGVHQVRSYGLWSPVHHTLLHHLQLRLAGHGPAHAPAAPASESQSTDSGCPPLRAGHPGPSCGPGLVVVIRSLPRLHRGPPGGPQLPPSLLTSAPSPPHRLLAGALGHPCLRLSRTLLGRPLPHHLTGPGTAPGPCPSAPFPPPRSVGHPPMPPRKGFSRGSAWITMPNGAVQRFSSTPLLCRLRATTTLLR
jgi:hypothetical protein